MKLLITLPLVLALSGCALVDAFLMTKYDPNEYKMITDIRSQAQFYKSQCSDSVQSKTNANKLLYESQTFTLYSEHVPRNTDVKKAAGELNAMVKGLSDQYENNKEVGSTFCKIKFETIEKSANRIQTIIGGRPR